MGRLTTHILDTASGKPAASVAIILYRVSENQTRTLVRSTISNQDGRTDSPLLEGPGFTADTYEIDFSVASYFKASKLETADPPFLDRVTLRFTVADAGAHYHVPLLVSPWAYSTYRGS